MGDTGWQVRAVDTVLQNCYSIFVSNALTGNAGVNTSTDISGCRTRIEARVGGNAGGGVELMIPSDWLP